MDALLPEVPYRPTVPVLLHRAVNLYGDADYVVVPGERLSFRSAEERSRELALRLLAEGVGKGTRVGIFLPTGIDWVVTWLAATRIGAIAMLLPATYRPPELRRSLAIGDVTVLFAPRSMFGRDYEPFVEEAIPSLTGKGPGTVFDPEVPHLRSVWVRGTSRPWAIDPDRRRIPGGEEAVLESVEAAVSPADPLLVIFTSGSSADPKAVVHTHGAAIRKIQPDLGMSLPGSFPGRTFCAMPFFWVGGPQDLLGAAHSGAAVVTQPRFDPAEALDLLERERCTSVLGWANLLQQLEADPTFTARDLSSLTVPESTLSSRGHPRNLGMTETFGPHANRSWFDYRVVDPETGLELPAGEEGEFWIRGFGLMAGFYGKEREEVFDRDGWYHTGDRGYLEDGHIWFTGRYSEMVKAGGANVSPLEVERALLSLPAVDQAYVIGVEDHERGQVVAAAVVLADGAAGGDPETLSRLLNRELSSYKVPTRWLVLSREEVPWLASGKPDKRALGQLFN